MVGCTARVGDANRGLAIVSVAGDHIRAGAIRPLTTLAFTIACPPPRSGRPRGKQRYPFPGAFGRETGDAALC